MAEDRNEAFLDWIVGACDRLLDRYAKEGKAVIASGAAMATNGTLESQPTGVSD